MRLLPIQQNIHVLYLFLIGPLNGNNKPCGELAIHGRILLLFFSHYNITMIVGHIFFDKPCRGVKKIIE